LIGRGEWIRTTDLTVPNRRPDKNLSFCLFKSCSHQENQGFCSSFPFVASASRCGAENSVHKLATNFSRLRLQWTMPLADVVTMLELLLLEYLKRRVFGVSDNRWSTLILGNNLRATRYRAPLTKAP